MDANGFWYGLAQGGPPQRPNVLIVGAGSRGNAYSRAIVNSGEGTVFAVADPIEFKRKELGRKYIWQNGEARPGQEFNDWREFLEYELSRRERAAAGEKVEVGVDAVFICTLDTQHKEAITGLAPLNLHVMSEKPLATTLDDCLDIYTSLLEDSSDNKPKSLFGIGHVLRYSPHNMLLRDLVLQDKVIGDILSLEHTEPVGWYHFSHSYVRGNWRKESTTAPVLLTKSTHDMDLLLWLLCSPPSPESQDPPHLPSKITSTGHLSYFRRFRKPASAGDATNCLSCPIESSCIYSAKSIYYDRFLKKGKTGWPVKIVNPEIEDCYNNVGAETAKRKLFNTLAEDYDIEKTPREEIEKRPWFGRCVWESDNDVCDDQTVTITWDDHLLTENAASPQFNRYAKTATFHMIAQTEAQCERRGRIYGTRGEIAYDSTTIRVCDFDTSKTKTHYPEQRGGGHGGGDDGLATHFLLAVNAVKNQGMSVEQAQAKYIGCTLEEAVRSHALVFAAEEARKETKVVDWEEWWARRVAPKAKPASVLAQEYEIV